MDKNETWFGAIQFDGAFEGYVKIPYTSLANDSTTFFMNPATDAVSQLVFHVDNIGGEHGSPVIGPAFIVVQDGFQGFLWFRLPNASRRLRPPQQGICPRIPKRKLPISWNKADKGMLRLIII